MKLFSELDSLAKNVVLTEIFGNVDTKLAHGEPQGQAVAQGGI